MYDLDRHSSQTQPAIFIIFFLIYCLDWHEVYLEFHAIPDNIFVTSHRTFTWRFDWIVIQQVLTCEIDAVSYCNAVWEVTRVPQNISFVAVNSSYGVRIKWWQKTMFIRAIYIWFVIFLFYLVCRLLIVVWKKFKKDYRPNKNTRVN